MKTTGLDECCCKGEKCRLGEGATWLKRHKVATRVETGEIIDKAWNKERERGGGVQLGNLEGLQFTKDGLTRIHMTLVPENHLRF
jgi:hypothetical protein